MPKLTIDFTKFRRDAYFWVGQHDVPWLAPASSFLIDTEDVELSNEYKNLVERICNLPRTVRNRLETFLYREYQDNIFDTLCGGLDVTPPISRPTEIWSLLTQPGIGIPSIEGSSPELLFAVIFECPWDPEHGLSIRFDENCNPVEIGGSCDFV